MYELIDSCLYMECAYIHTYIIIRMVSIATARYVYSVASQFTLSVSYLSKFLHVSCIQNMKIPKI